MLREPHLRLERLSDGPQPRWNGPLLLHLLRRQRRAEPQRPRRLRRLGLRRGAWPLRPHFPCRCRCLGQLPGHPRELRNQVHLASEHGIPLDVADGDAACGKGQRYRSYLQPQPLGAGRLGHLYRPSRPCHGNGGAHRQRGLQRGREDRRHCDSQCSGQGLMVQLHAGCRRTLYSRFLCRLDRLPALRQRLQPGGGPAEAGHLAQAGNLFFAADGYDHQPHQGRRPLLHPGRERADAILQAVHCAPGAQLQHACKHCRRRGQ